MSRPIVVRTGLPLAIVAGIVLSASESRAGAAESSVPPGLSIVVVIGGSLPSCSTRVSSRSAEVLCRQIAEQGASCASARDLAGPVDCKRFIGWADSGSYANAVEAAREAGIDLLIMGRYTAQHSQTPEGHQLFGDLRFHAANTHTGAVLSNRNETLTRELEGPAMTDDDLALVQGRLTHAGGPKLLADLETQWRKEAQRGRSVRLIIRDLGCNGAKRIGASAKRSADITKVEQLSCTKEESALDVVTRLSAEDLAAYLEDNGPRNLPMAIAEFGHYYLVVESDED